jgi:hypothetical protein
MSRVFIPQLPSRFDTQIKQWVPTVSIDSAKTFGELQIMLPPEAYRLSPETIVETLQKVMADYGPDDYLLALGDPFIIGIAAAIADRASTPLRMLRWDRMAREYQALEANLGDDE